MIVGIVMGLVAATLAAVGGGLEHAKRKNVQRAGRGLTTIGSAVGAATPWVEQAAGKHKR